MPAVRVGAADDIEAGSEAGDDGEEGASAAIRCCGTLFSFDLPPPCGSLSADSLCGFGLECSGGVGIWPLSSASPRAVRVGAAEEAAAAEAIATAADDEGDNGCMAVALNGALAACRTTGPCDTVAAGTCWSCRSDAVEL